ncbi:type I pantothenate kinase [Atopobacter phocae]|uniref:type I pantothenate kinase n=1 Tax=Atopobacter phocae TaxID=136492 RepID=UPI00046EFE92|nr:type I pantothenate kinase [Atopobacter phocae]
MVRTIYQSFERERWKHLQSHSEVMISQERLVELTSLNDRIDQNDVEEIYLPLLGLLDCYRKSFLTLKNKKNEFLEMHSRRSPFIIGISGSVAVGKSTTARLIKTLLERAYSEQELKVDLLTTDGFLYSNQKLETLGLMSRKGFPESYDMKRLLNFLTQVKSGEKNIQVPKYSHDIYDIIEGEYDVVDRPDILIVEGINVLQLPANHEIFVSDFFDVSLFVDADEALIEKWYLERFKMHLTRAKDDPSNYYYHYAIGDWGAAFDMAATVWRQINLVNLRQFIKPTMGRADIILHKTDNHLIDRVSVKV